MKKLNRDEDRIKKILTHCKIQGFIDNDQFTDVVSEMVIDLNGSSYLCTDPLSNGQVNLEIVNRLNNNIKKHPLLWKLFFAVKGW
jgi:hypothetical protein